MNINNELFETLMEDTELFSDVMVGDIEGCVFEGATFQTYKTIAGANTKAIKQAYKDANKFYKNGDYKKAIQKINECKAGYTKLKNDLNKIEDTLWGDVCGYILGNGILTLFFTVKASGGKGAAEWFGTGLLGLIMAYVASPISIMSNAIKLASNKAQGVDTSNFTKSEIIKAIDENIKVCNKLADEIKKKMK